MRRADTELERLRQFCLVVLEFISELAPLTDSAVRNEFVRGLEGARSLRGLREATRDMVEWGQDLSRDQLAVLDSRLAALGLPSFSLMRAKRASDVSRVLARGAIATEEEYRLLTAVVSNLDTPDVSANDRALAERLLGQFQPPLPRR